MPGFEIIDKKEKKAVNQLFSEGAVFIAHGLANKRKKFHVREFEKNCSNFFNSKYCLAVSSGTAAIKIALLSIGIKPGDEVITQAFNFIATIEAILDCGATPIICNVDKTLNMDPKELESLISKKTRAIIPVHMLGVAAEMNMIKKIAIRHKIRVIEDNCEAIGAKYMNNYLGTISDAGIFSFDYGKMITTGEGGMILTNKLKIDKFSREYHDHGHQNNPRLPRGKDSKKIYGFNYRMTEIQATIGKVQLKKLNFMLKQNYQRYALLEKELIKKFELRLIPDNSVPTFDTFIFFVKDKILRKKIVDLLIAKKIGTKNLPDAIEWHCAYFWEHALSKKHIIHSKKTKKILETAIAIPIWLSKSKKQYSYIGKAIAKIKND
tara:strand:+ start:13863 stop:14999 length:1137 start_codon:yes stop_codon:yes gene_type:complete